jgi:hypothetical protein
MEFRMNIDLTKASIEELAQIQNEVLRNIALLVAREGRGGLAAGHDSHGSYHSKNSVLARPGIEKIQGV